jgi:hypothetical protein
MAAVQVFIDKDKRVWSRDPVYFFPTTLGSNHYLNFVYDLAPRAAKDGRQQSRDDGKAASRGHLFAKYVLDGDCLTIWFMEMDGFEDRVRQGLLRGEVREEGSLLKVKVVTVTDSTTSLQRFIQDNDAVLFPKEKGGVFRRMK